MKTEDGYEDLPYEEILWGYFTLQDAVDFARYAVETTIQKIYHDNGRQSIAEAAHKAVDYALAKDAVIYRSASPADYRLSQVADYICAMEFTALKYADKASTATDEKFFGSWAQFKKGILKEIRAKRV